MIYLLGLLLQWKFLSEQGAYKEHAFDQGTLLEHRITADKWALKGALSRDVCLGSRDERLQTKACGGIDGSTSFFCLYWICYITVSVFFCFGVLWNINSPDWELNPHPCIEIAVFKSISTIREIPTLHLILVSQWAAFLPDCFLCQSSICVLSHLLPLSPPAFSRSSTITHAPYGMML